MNNSTLSEKPTAASSQIIRATPPTPPKGLILGEPDFVGIGAQKSGTSWWYSLIVQHPGIYQPKFMLGKVEPPFLIKERHFFDRFHLDQFSDAHRNEYLAWFPRPKGLKTGEWTPRYLATTATLAQTF